MHTQGTFSAPSRNLQCTFRERSVNLPAQTKIGCYTTSLVAHDGHQVGSGVECKQELSCFRRFRFLVLGFGFSFRFCSFLYSFLELV
jgi:hypothetical protein